MSELIFNQNFVFCSVCHQRSSVGSPLMLTSCAHTLCNKHLTSTGVCPICNNRDISTIKLVDEKTLPTDVKLFFEPLPNSLESIYNISLFQINGLNEQVQYYQSHCIKLREKVARQQQLLYQAKNELDTIPVLKQKIQFLEETLKSLNNSGSRRNTQGKSIYTTSGEFPFFQKKGNTSFTGSSNSNKCPPPTVDLTLDNDEYSEQQQFISKLKHTTTLRNPQRNQSVQPNNIKDLSNYNFNEKINRGVRNVRANTVDLNYAIGKTSSNTSRRINNSNNIPIPNDDIAMAESTQLNKFNSSSEYQPMSPGQIPSISGIPSPNSTNTKGEYYQNNKANNNNNLVTPPEKNMRSITKGLGMSKDDLQRRRMSTIASGRIQFPTPLEKLKIGKRPSNTNNSSSNKESPSILQYMKRRSSTSQVDSPTSKQFANKITKNNNNNNSYYRGQTAKNFK